MATLVWRLYVEFHQQVGGPNFGNPQPAQPTFHQPAQPAQPFAHQPVPNLVHRGSLPLQTQPAPPVQQPLQPRMTMPVQQAAQVPVYQQVPQFGSPQQFGSPGNASPQQLQPTVSGWHTQPGVQPFQHPQQAPFAQPGFAFPEPQKTQSVWTQPAQVFQSSPTTVGLIS